MGDLGKITITKNKDCDNKTYYSAYIYGIDAVIGGGDTRNEAKDELFGNIVLYVNYLIETNQKLKQQLEEKDKEIESLKQQLAEAEEYIENDEVTKREYYQKTDEIIAEKDKEIERLKDFINCKKQFAIQELEKVKEDCFNQKELVDFGNVACFMVDIADIFEIINNQIKELKGEKK